MKKIYLTIIVLIVATQVSFGQWTTSGTNINSTNTGNVGIGTTSPQTKLHVVGGEIRLAGQGSSGVTSTSFISFYDSNNSTRYGWLGDGGVANNDITLYADAGNSLHFATNGVNDRMFISTTGYVGIGTITPGRPLDVNGIIQTNAGLTFNNGKVWDIASNGNNLFFDETAIGTRMTFLAGGNVGIGTINPAVKLSVTPSVAAGLNSAFTSIVPVVNIAPAGGNGVMIIEGSNSSIAGGVIALRNNRSANFAYNGSSFVNDMLGALTFEGFSTTTGISRLGAYITSNVESVQSTSLSGNLKFMTTDATGTTAARLYISAGGNVGIGTVDNANWQLATSAYKLAVNGSAIATSMTVKLNANWPDYVFKPDYRLPSLQEVKSYIDQNHHLPDMPSATEVEKDGLNLGEMNKLLAKKVEELTIYLIEKDKKEKEQEQINQDLRNRLDKLEQKVNGQ